MPAATEKSLATGVLVEKGEGYCVLTKPNTDYAVRLETEGTIAGEVGKRVTGVIALRARRMDVITGGGRYIEPVSGRPRRVQGRVTETDASANTVTVDAAFPVVVTPHELQRADQFELTSMVSFDAHPGATFTPAG